MSTIIIIFALLVVINYGVNIYMNKKSNETN
jgi:hypothetical protein